MRIGVDLGGTKIEAVGLDDSGALLIRRRVATPRGKYLAIVEAVVTIVDEVEAELGEQGTVGIGTPGAISPATGLIKNSNSVELNGQPLEEHLSGALGRPVRTANDADCFALSEATDGAGEAFRSVFGVILGTGVGGGLVVQGNLLQGPNAIAGEWGHNPLTMSAAEQPGPDCYCGRRGCVETWVSGPGLARDFKASTGRDATAEEVGRLAATGDEAALETVERYADRLARALAVVLNIVDPYLVVLGGGVSRLDSLCELVPARWEPYVFSDRIDTPVRRAMHGDASGARGAAWLWESN